MDAHAGVHVVGAARQAPQEPAGVVVVDRLAEQVAVEVDGGVGRDHQLAGRGHCGGLLPGQALDVGRPGLAGPHRLVEVGRAQLEGQPQPREQLEAPRRARGQDQSLGRHPVSRR